MAEHGKSSRLANTNFEAVILQDLEDELLDTIAAPVPTNKPAVQVNGYGPPRDQASNLTGINVVPAHQTNMHSNFPSTIQTHAQIESYLDKRL